MKFIRDVIRNWKRGIHPKLDQSRDCWARFQFNSLCTLDAHKSGDLSRMKNDLLYQALHGHLEEVEHILEFTDGNVCNSIGLTPLMHAAWQNHKEVVMALLPKCDVRAQTPGGATALSIARKYGHQAIVDVIEHHLGELDSQALASELREHLRSDAIDEPQPSNQRVRRL